MVALDQMGSRIGKDLQKLFQALVFLLAESPCCEVLSEFVSPAIKTEADLFIRYTPSSIFACFILITIFLIFLFFLTIPSTVQHLFSIQNPLPHPLHLIASLSPTFPFFHYLLQTIQFLLTYLTYCPPFFSSSSRLVATSSKASDASTPAYVNGNLPSKLSAVCTPNP